MKKLLCLILALMMVLTAVLSLTVSATDEVEGDYLIITADGQDPVAVEVGNEFIFRVGLYAGPTKILDGQATIKYDSSLLEVVKYEVADKDGDYSMEAYCFPNSIYKTGPVMNVDNPGEVNYNFTKANGIAVFDDASQLFARFRFKAIAPGKTDLTNIIQYMIDVQEIRIYNKDLANPEVGPYMVQTIEPSLGCVGDADDDYQVTILDATMMQRAAAGVVDGLDLTVADTNGDYMVSLKDAIAVRKYLAGIGENAVGTWIFESEQAEAV